MRATDSSRSSRWSRGSSSASDKQSDREASCTDRAKRWLCVDPVAPGTWPSSSLVSSDRVRASRARSSTEKEQDVGPWPFARNRASSSVQRFPNRLEIMTSSCFSPPPLRPPIDLNDQSDTVKVECVLLVLRFNRRSPIFC